MEHKAIHWIVMKASKEARVNFRIDETTLKKLMQEAKADGRTLSNYLVYLITTHPKRTKKD